jgi:ABC-type transporter MlaC component
VSKETVTEFSKFFEDYVMRRYNSLLRGENE